MNLNRYEPKVSVITPVYNAEKYIREVMESVRNSTYPNIEYVVINDGSTDNSKQVILECASKFESKIIFIDSKNQGEANAVNTAYKEITGDFVLVVNADDPIDTNLINKQIEIFAKKPEIVVVYPNWKMIDKFGQTIGETLLPDYSYKYLVGDFVCLPGPGTMFKKTALSSSLPRSNKFKYVSDYELWLKLALTGDFFHIKETLATWRNHGQNLSFTSSNGQNARELIELNKNFFQNTKLPKKIKKLKRRSRSYVYYHAASMGVNDRGIPTLHYLIRSISIFYLPNFSHQVIRRKVFITLIAYFIQVYKEAKAKFRNLL